MSSNATRQPPIPPRHDGWTVERQKIFIEMLARTRNVSRAAAAAGMSREGAYRFRRRPDGAMFASTWDWVLSLPPRPRVNIEVHNCPPRGPGSNDSPRGKGHKAHGSQFSAIHHQLRRSKVGLVRTRTP